MDQLLLKKNGKTICWRKLTIEDEDEVEKLMKEYCKNEPMYAIRYSAESEAKAIETSKTLLKENLSLGAYDLEDKDHLCAINVISVHHPESDDIAIELKKANENYRTGPSIFLRFALATLNSFEEVLRTEKCLFHIYAVTTAKYQRMGITTQLQKKFEAICKEQKCRYIIGIYTSEFTKRSSKKLGYKDIGELNYADYLDPLTKEKPFKDMKYHTSTVAMYFDVEECEK